MRVAKLTGGGILDGDRVAVDDQIDHVIAVHHGGANHHYALSDDTGEYAYAGPGQTGEIMTEIIRQDREAAAADRAAIEEARRPRGCRKCGRTFADLASWTVHRDPGWPGGCLPGDALGQLVDVDGVLCLLGSAAAGS